MSRLAFAMFTAVDSLKRNWIRKEKMETKAVENEKNMGQSGD